MELNKIYQMDCLEGLKQLKDNSVDLVVTDPPFSFGVASSITNSKIDNWTDLMNGSHFFKDLIIELKRVCKVDSAIWIFNSWKSYPCLLKAICMADSKIESLLCEHF